MVLQDDGTPAEAVVPEPLLLDSLGIEEFCAPISAN